MAPVPDWLRPILEPVRHNEDVKVRECIRQVGVGRGKRNLYLVLVELLYVSDRLQRAGAA